MKRKKSGIQAHLEISFNYFGLSKLKLFIYSFILYISVMMFSETICNGCVRVSLWI